MEYKRVGASGLNVSELALGTQNFAMSVDEKTAEVLVDTFIDAGGNSQPHLASQIETV